jgi:hypothetical protein
MLLAILICWLLVSEPSGIKPDRSDHLLLRSLLSSLCSGIIGPKYITPRSHNIYGKVGVLIAADCGNHCELHTLRDVLQVWRTGSETGI